MAVRRACRLPRSAPWLVDLTSSGVGVHGATRSFNERGQARPRLPCTSLAARASEIRPSIVKDKRGSTVTVLVRLLYRAQAWVLRHEDSPMWFCVGADEAARPLTLRTCMSYNEWFHAPFLNDIRSDRLVFATARMIGGQFKTRSTTYTPPAFQDVAASSRSWTNQCLKDLGNQDRWARTNTLDASQAIQPPDREGAKPWTRHATTLREIRASSGPSLHPVKSPPYRRDVALALGLPITADMDASGTRAMCERAAHRYHIQTCARGP
ncbi:hypothetical protein FA95DRAFT_1614260 [Auriscalpium vulgare]|uniref:Uncharacterized protein n=1 Tax=Auriscalpium vulgare TaxID=40419 RepID=A0ACB8QZT4_9AGAM|nr:hypothetical protein FA95DRAFT_1614260 [Auriscalpium vulgare]